MKKHLRAMCLMALLLLVATPMMAGDFNLGTALEKFYSEMGFTSFFIGTGWKNLVMLAVGCAIWLSRKSMNLCSCSPLPLV